MSTTPTGTPVGTQAMPPGAADALVELARIDLTADLADVLGLLAGLAKRAIPGADEVSFTIVRRERPCTPAFTGDLALQVDEQQYESGYGPCLDAAATAASVVVVTDMRTDSRWPEYAPRAAAAGVRSSVSVGLPAQHELSGAINVYSVTPDAFDDGARGLAQWFAGYAAVAVTNAARYADATVLSRQLTEAMASRAIIEQAKGVLMAVHGYDADAAFADLTRASQRRHQKLREVAADVVRRTAKS